MAGGRPTEYRAEFHPENYIELCKKGLTLAEVCCEWHIARETLWKWSKDERKPEFINAIKIGDEYRQRWWICEAKRLTEAAKCNAAIFIFMTKNVLGWSDRNEIILPEKVSITITQDEAAL